MADTNHHSEEGTEGNAFSDALREHLGQLESELNLPRQGRSLCLLVVADMDLPSASMLAESALRELPKGGTLVDGIVACGPFVTPESLHPYMQQQYEEDELSQQPLTGTNLSPELTFALEGLVTGCLSQLESIACRVAWIPSTDRDPSSLWLHHGTNTPIVASSASALSSLLRPSRYGRYEELQHEGEKRLTPNSRNIDRQSLPLAPGLSCCGLAIGPAGSQCSHNAIPLAAEHELANSQDEYVGLGPVV